MKKINYKTAILNKEYISTGVWELTVVLENGLKVKRLSANMALIYFVFDGKKVSSKFEYKSKEESRKDLINFVLGYSKPSERSYNSDLILEYLESCMDEIGMSRYKLSKITGISESSLSKYFNQIQDMSYSNYIKICKAIGLL